MKTPPVALWLWYRGDRFRGYQRQPEGPTVQEALETALTTLGVDATPAPSGRTDRGVHARMQVVSFRPRGGADPAELAARLRPLLPEGLGIAAARLGSPAFHAQWSAAEKEYRYRIRLGAGPAEWRPFSWEPTTTEPRLSAATIVPERLAETLAMARGTRDFIAFHEKSSVRKRRCLVEASLIDRGGGLFEAVLRGDGFARYQVRYLVGTAVGVAAARIPVEQYLAALEEGQSLAGIKAPGEGLILWEVGYSVELDPFIRDRADAAVPAEPPFTPAC